MRVPTRWPLRPAEWWASHPATLPRRVPERTWAAVEGSHWHRTLRASLAHPGATSSLKSRKDISATHIQYAHYTIWTSTRKMGPDPTHRTVTLSRCVCDIGMFPWSCVVWRFDFFNQQQHTNTFSILCWTDQCGWSRCFPSSDLRCLQQGPQFFNSECPKNRLIGLVQPRRLAVWPNWKFSPLRNRFHSNMEVSREAFVLNKSSPFPSRPSLSKSTHCRDTSRWLSEGLLFGGTEGWWRPDVIRTAPVGSIGAQSG